jgi:hypothetical protein
LRIARRDGARRGALVRREGGWEVLVMRGDVRPAPLAPHERFTIAHELGHLVLLQEANFRPGRRAEYWLGEALCQHFASRLLIGAELLDRVPQPGSTEELVAAVNWVACHAEVTAEPAARALIERIERPVAIGTFELAPLERTRRLGFRGWWVENRRWWAARGGRRLAVYRDHPLAPALDAMARIGPGEQASPELSGARSTLLRRRNRRRASFTALLA